MCVGTRKTIKVRFENNKEVPCEWWYYYKADVASTSSKEGERFSVHPLNGTLLPGQKQTVDIMFMPVQEKQILQKLNFKVKENPRLFTLNAKGTGISYNMEVLPDSLQLGPVLPYEHKGSRIFEIRNPMDFPIEVFAVDFDKQFQEEEDILKRYDPF